MRIPPPASFYSKLFYIACLNLIIYSCSGNNYKDQNIFVIGIENSPTNLDPRFALDHSSTQIIQLIFNSLLTKDLHGNLMPDLAEKWEIIDNKEYIFHLNKVVRFHDGSEMTSSDVKYTYDFVLNEKNKSPKIIKKGTTFFSSDIFIQ